MNAAPAQAPERPPAVRHAPIVLWRIAETFLRTLHMLFSSPEDIARCNWIDKDRYALIRCWIACGEAMLRRLLLIEAAAYPRMDSKPCSARPSRPRVRKLMSFSADKPEEWRTTFRTMERGRPRPRTQQRKATPEPKEGVLSMVRYAWPIAERFEALLRVFNDPAPYAKRLARKLYAHPDRVADVMRAPDKAREYVPDWPVLNHKAETETHAFAKPPRADSS